MPKRYLEAYSGTTGKTYPNWEALVEAEANGYAAVAIISDGNDTWPWVVGPFPTEREAVNEAASIRRKVKKGEYDDLTVKVTVRPAWKTAKERKKIANG